MFKRRVFVSYASRDQDKAGFLTSRLGAEGFEVFFAPRTIAPSQDFEIAIDRELARCDAFIVLISEAANESEWVKTEIGVALNHYNNRQLKFLIPIVIEADVKPPARIARIQHYKATTGELQEWDSIATQISKQIRAKDYLLVSLALLLLTSAVFFLEAWIGNKLYYLPFILILEGLTIAFVWFNLQTRSKWLSLILVVPLAVQFIFVGYNLATLRRNESEQAKASALALCNAANDRAFDYLWDEFASLRSHHSFENGLRDVLDNKELSLSSKINAMVALARLEVFEAVTAKLDPNDNTTFFEFTRKPDRWLKGLKQLDWVLTWLNSRDSRGVIWGVRALGLAHEIMEKFSVSTLDKVRDRLLNLLKVTDNAGILNNCRWTLSEIESDQNAIAQANKARQSSPTSLDHLSTSEIGYLGITLILVKVSGLQTFYISDTEITNEQFSHFADESSKFTTSAEKQKKSSCFGHDGAWYECEASWKKPGLPIKISPEEHNLPVIHVSWVDAIQFCNWLSVKENLMPAYTESAGIWTLVEGSNGYRLPTITEWQTASQAGTQTPFWWAASGDWQNDKTWKCLFANLPDASFFINWKKIDTIAGDDHFAFHAPVRTFAPNDWGLFETIGNVGEWCDEDNQFKLCPEYAPGKKPRVGGSWGDGINAVSAKSCRAEGPETSHVNVGFRIVRTVR